MGRYSISRKAWQTATNILLYYPDNKREYASLLDMVLTAGYDEEGNSNGTDSDVSDPTARAAIRLANNKRAARLKIEIEAVDLSVAELSETEREVIRRRFWNRRQNHRPRQYDYLQDLPYSQRQMHRIVARTIYRIAQLTGEV